MPTYYSDSVSPDWALFIGIKKDYGAEAPIKRSERMKDGLL